MLRGFKGKLSVVSRRLLALGVCTVVLAACGREEDSHERSSSADYNPALDEWSPQNADEFNFIAFGGGVYGLVGVSKKETIKICLSGVSSNNLEKWQGWITDSVLKWLKPLRSLTTDPIAAKVDVVSGGSGCDAKFQVVNGAWGYTSIGNIPSITVGPNVPFGVVIHEFGHAFALGDTYRNGTSGNCQPGQPQSLMCNISFSDLQPDDIAGMKQVFKSKFPNDVPGPVTPTPTPTPTPGQGDTRAEADLRVAVKKASKSKSDYTVFFSAVGQEALGTGSMTYCYASDSDCSVDANFKPANFVGYRAGGVTQIYQAVAPVKVDAPLMVYVRYESADSKGEATFKVQKR